MYREPAPPPPVHSPSPEELLYPFEDRERRRLPSMGMYQIVLFPILAGTALTIAAGPLVGLVGLVGTGVVVYRWWTRAGKGGVLLRVERGDLSVLDARSNKVKARLRLAELEDVTMDTKTIQPTMEGSSPIAGLRFVTSQALPEVDQKRIVFVGKDEPVPLTEAYLANVDATEWFGKIRVFLRKQGWVPESEREAAREE